jgi:LuxR family maltose regulon positive regulatory protein
MGDQQQASNSITGSGGMDSSAGSPPLIVTKIQAPRRHPDLLARKRLVDFLHSHLDRRLILISAPAGYGKTSLLADFTQEIELPVCWYTLDRFDGDFRVFLEYLIAAIARQFPAFGQRSRAFLGEVKDPGSEIYSLVATLVREIYEAIPEYFVLVLDDHHTVQDQEQIGEFLDLLLTYADENLHLILASRELPALPGLALLVARRQAAGISVDELRFTAQEIQALARRNYGHELTREQASSLATRTGGWITGLLLTAAPHWQRVSAVEGELPVRGQINVNLYDYFSQQVLDQQPVALRDFLLSSSVLDELSPALCTEVLGIEEPAPLLSQLRSRNLFVIEFEGDEGRLRYHDLFRDFLQTTLRRQNDHRFRQLARAAAEAYADRGEWARAVSRYLELDEYGPVADIVQRTATELFELGRWDTLADWIEALPEEVLMHHPRFLVHRAKIHASRGEQGQAIALYERAERAFAASGDQGGAASAVAYRGYSLCFQGHYAQAIADCRQALVWAGGKSDQESFTQALAQKSIGYSQLRLGQLAEGQEALRQALHLYEGLGDFHDAGLVYHDLGLSYDLAGNLDAAAKHYRAALEHWQELGTLGPWANTLNGLGVVYHLQGRYDEALEALKQALGKARQIGYGRVEALTWASLGDLYRDQGQYRLAQEAYDAALQAATRVEEGFVVTYALAGQGDICRRVGDLARAAELLHEAMKHAESHHSAYEVGLCHLLLGLLAGDRRDPSQARDHLDQAVARFEAGGFGRDLARAYLYRAQVAFRAGDRAGALAELEQALSLAAELGLDQFLIAEGEQVRPLLRHASAQGVDERTVSHLLERIEEHLARVAFLRRMEQDARQAEGPGKQEQALKIYALGLIRVELGEQAIQWRSLQSRDLLFCLLQHPQGLRKEAIGELFWPDHTPQKLHTIFHSTLYRLRRALPQESVVFEDGVYAFNRQRDYWFDVEAFDGLLGLAAGEGRSGLRIAQLTEALNLYRGDYLAGVYGDWPTLERERLRERFLAALEELAGLYVDQGNLTQAAELYRRVLAEAPYQESAHRGLMACYSRLGDRAGAIRQYHRCVELLREELGLSPMSETEELYLKIIS